MRPASFVSVLMEANLRFLAVYDSTDWYKPLFVILYKEENYSLETYLELVHCLTKAIQEIDGPLSQKPILGEIWETQTDVGLYELEDISHSVP